MHHAASTVETNDVLPHERESGINKREHLKIQRIKNVRESFEISRIKFRKFKIFFTGWKTKPNFGFVFLKTLPNRHEWIPAGHTPVLAGAEVALKIAD